MGFYQNMVKYFRISLNIVNNCDVLIHEQILENMFNLNETRLKLFNANHSQTDGQMKRMDALFECMRHYVLTMQRNPLELLDSAKLCYNLHKSLATEASPFELVLGAQP